GAASLQETHEPVAVAIDTTEQLLTPRVHLDLPRSMSIPARRQPSGHTFFPPRLPMLADGAISVILSRPQAGRPVPASGLTGTEQTGTLLATMKALPK